MCYPPPRNDRGEWKRKPGAGTCPVRGHSNVQGQRTVGITEKPELMPLELIDWTGPKKEGLPARVIGARVGKGPRRFAIVTHVDDDRLDEEVDSLAQRFASGPTRGLARIKKMIRESWSHSLDSELDRQRDAMRELGFSDDYREGVAAFIEKRKPNFTGK